MNKLIAIFLSMIQSLDVTWRVIVTFLAFVFVICLTLFIFFPLFLSLLQAILKIMRKGIVLFTGLCMKNWGKLVIRWRRKTGRYPQFLVSVEDFFVSVVTVVSRFLDKVAEWKPKYGAIGVRVSLVSAILFLFVNLALWVLPASGQVLKSFYTDWEREYVLGSEQPAEMIAEALSPQRNKDLQIYYKITGENAELRKKPDGEVITTITDSSLLIRYLGETEEQWMLAEIIDSNRQIKGWIHKSQVKQWEISKKLLLLFKPGDNVRISGPGIPIFTCKLIGLEQADDGTVTVIFKSN